MLDGLLLRLILRIQNVFVRCILFTYIVCHSITAKVLSNLFQLSVWKFSKQNCREMPIKILIIISFSSEQLTLIIIEENCRLTPYDIKFKKSKFLIENAGHWSHHSLIYAHEMDYAHIKLDLIYQELSVKDWHLWQGFFWKMPNWWCMWPWPCSVTSDQGHDKVIEQSIISCFQKVINCTWMACFWSEEWLDGWE